MEKSFEPGQIESKWYAAMGGAAATSSPREDGEPYCILLPPPNVTGTLHMGHAFQQTIMDALIRYHRMRGFSTLWQGGTDHAGIATQKIVENQLAARRQDAPRPRPREVHRARLGMERGIRLDDHEPDAPPRRVGRLVARTLHDGRRPVRRGAPRIRRVVSRGPDLSRQAARELGSGAEDRGVRPRSQQRGDATARCGRSAIRRAMAAKASSSRRRVRKRCSATSPSRCIRTTSATSADRQDAETAADRPRDSGHRRRLRRSRVRHRRGQDHAGARFQRLADRRASQARAARDPHARREDQRRTRRKNIAASTASPRARPCSRISKRAGLLVETKKHKLQVPISQRSRRGDRADADRSVVPRSDQRRARRRQAGPGGRKAITEPASNAVRGGDIRFVPENWTTTYNQWLENIQDWCVSRQLWWGHRFRRGTTRPATSSSARTKPKRARMRDSTPVGALRQDDDVLDTWFSSALWPFSTLGWPRRNAANARPNGTTFNAFVPSSVLVTGFDIIFFWVARMVMATSTSPARAVSRGLHQRDRARCGRPEDVEVEGQHDRSARPDRRHRPRRAGEEIDRVAADSAGAREGREAHPQGISRTAFPRSAPTRCASRSPRSPRTAARSISISSAPRATRTSATSCGMRRASC